MNWSILDQVIIPARIHDKLLQFKNKYEHAEITDKLGFSQRVAHYQRIISLVPSITETLFDLHLGDYVIGVTQFCIYPEEAKNKTKIGGTKNPSIEKIRVLQPDIILTNKEETPKEIVQLLQKEFQVFVTFPRTIYDNIELLLDLGTLLSVPPLLIEKKIFLMLQQINRLQQLPLTNKRSVFCPIWRNPWMSINNDTYIHEILQSLNLQNVTARAKNRYPSVNLHEIMPVDIVLLPSEPYHFTEEHINELKTYSAFKNAKFYLIDGSYLSWYGSRFVKAVDVLISLFY